MVFMRTFIKTIFENECITKPLHLSLSLRSDEAYRERGYVQSTRQSHRAQSSSTHTVNGKQSGGSTRICKCRPERIANQYHNLTSGYETCKYVFWLELLWGLYWKIKASHNLIWPWSPSLRSDEAYRGIGSYSLEGKVIEHSQAVQMNRYA